MTPEAFVDRWKDSGGAELANSQSFLKELCDLLDVPQPDPTRPDAATNQYVFGKAVEFNNGDGTVSFGRVDLFRSGCFVLESKQGSERKAAEQAEALTTVTKTAKKLGGTPPRHLAQAAPARPVQTRRRCHPRHRHPTCQVTPSLEIRDRQQRSRVLPPVAHFRQYSPAFLRFIAWQRHGIHQCLCCIVSVSQISQSLNAFGSRDYVGAKESGKLTQVL